MALCLIVDDDHNSRLIAGEIARSCGFEVDEAVNGLHALELCKKRLPDVIVLDWMMPEMNGVSFLELLDDAYMDDKPKVLMCSAKYSENDLRHCFEYGAVEYLRKPVRSRDMHMALSKYI